LGRGSKINYLLFNARQKRFVRLEREGGGEKEGQKQLECRKKLVYEYCFWNMCNETDISVGFERLKKDIA
jgi:hypothetical protein